MNVLLEVLNSASAPDRESHRPEFFRMAFSNDRARLQELLKNEARVIIHDGLHDQLTELVRSLNPSRKFTKEELNAAAVAHLKGVPSEDYGVWVYFPWSFRLVHLLDETEFALVRTDRNRNKITSEEQALLATKKVGVIGLSVGQSVSLTMALERSFGEIRLADFDTLELSNLNRIRSGVHEMGIPKVINTAREIAELDPYLKVTIYPEGSTKENLHAFFTEGGKLDVLIEECDSVDIKILARIKAKELGVPVVMDTSDRGLIDVERFDLEPDRPIMHGFLSDEHLAMVEGKTDHAQRYDLLMRMVDLEGLSEPMQRCLPEIGRTLVTWPQLGGHVAMGGALASEAVRKILLQQMEWSGRWYIDPEELFQTKRSSLIITEPDQEKPHTITQIP